MDNDQFVLETILLHHSTDLQQCYLDHWPLSVWLTLFAASKLTI